MIRYRINTRKVSFAEIRTEASLPIAILTWLIMRLPFSIPSASDHPAVHDLEPFRLGKDAVAASIPHDVMAKISELANVLKPLGFQGTVYHKIVDENQQSTIYHASYVHSTGAAIARIRYRISRLQKPAKILVSSQFISQKNDKTFFVTSTGKPDLQTPDSVDEVYEDELDQTATWESHRQRIVELARKQELVPIKSGRAIVDALQAHHALIRDHLIERKVFKAIEVESHTTEGVSGSVSGESGSMPDSQLVDAVRKLEAGKRQNWISSALLLLVSGALFVAAGAANWSLQFAGMLLIVLFIHECGHYIFMKYFDYQNVKMFFIPLFGAAVSGRNYNVDGWQRIVVSLMGPLPGIGIGVVLGIFGIVQDQQWAINAASLMVLLNGFNLVPALPLDGGWVMHALLFCRHPILDLAFRVLAILGMLLLAALGGKILMYVAISMAIGLPTAFRIAKIADRLKKDPNVADSKDSRSIPAETIERIGSEIDDSIAGVNLSTKSQLVLQVFETINSKPPGVAASLALGGVYLGGLLTTVVAGVAFVIAQQADLGSFMMSAAMAPETPLIVADMQAETPDNDLNSLVAERSIVANFASVDSARDAVESLGAQFDVNSYAVVGQTVIVPVPADATAHGEWMAHLESLTEQVYIDRDEMRSSVRVMCIAQTKDDAEDIVAAVNGAATFGNLIPPWSKAESVTDEHRQARETYTGLNEVIYNDDESVQAANEKLFAQIQEARRTAQDDLADNLLKEQKQAYHDRQLQRIAKFRSESEGSLDLTVIDLYEQHVIRTFEAEQDPDYEYEPLLDSPQMKEIAERMGTENPTSGMSMNSCYATANGLLINIESATFHSLASGSVAFFQWLDEKGCVDFKYSITTFSLGFDE